MKKYREEYFSIKLKLESIKSEIAILNDKYLDGDNWGSRMMEVIQKLYTDRKGDGWYEEDIINNYDSECWIGIEEISEMMDLFIERKKLKRRRWLIKWLILRHFLYYSNNQ